MNVNYPHNLTWLHLFNEEETIRPPDPQWDLDLSSDEESLPDYELSPKNFPSRRPSTAKP